MKLTPQKLEGWATVGENCIIITSTVLTDPPVWQTDGQKDRLTGDSIAR